jgi:hypothetical protein
MKTVNDIQKKILHFIGFLNIASKLYLYFDIFTYIGFIY